MISFIRKYENHIIDALIVALVALLVPQIALAQGGFAATATNALENILDVIVIVVGIIAVFALLWTLAKGFMSDQTSWSDVFIKCLWIVGAGAAPALARWIFATGQKMTF